VFNAAGFHQLEPMAPPPRETRVGLDKFCPGTDSSLTEAGLPKFYVASNELHNKHLRPSLWSAVKIRDKTLLMWVRQEILARHTNQGKGSSNASVCAALITIVLFMANEFCQSLS
jgi:hypothetical protein